MPRDDSQFFGRELAQIKKAIADLKSGRLQNASIHGTRLYVYDDEGDVREVIGNQGDGSYGSRVILSPPQPTPTAPILPASDGDDRVATVFAVRWDGGIVQGVVPVVHGRVDVWTQKLAQGEEPDPSAAVLSGSIRDQQGGVTDVVVQGAGTYAVWLQVVGADRVTKGEFSQPAVVEVTALVDTERLEGALKGDLPDGIYNSLMARLAEFLHVRADQIDVNSLAADEAFIAYLEAAGIVLTNESGGRRFEVSGDGWRLTDTGSGQVMAQLGTQSDDLLSLHDTMTGNPVITMTQDGGISGQSLASENEILLGGKPLVGDLLGSTRWHSAGSALDMLGRGVIARHRRSFNNDNSGNTTNGQAIAFIEFPTTPGRLYRLKVHGFQMRDRQPYYLQAFYTTSSNPSVRPALPTRLSLTYGQQPGVIPPASGDGNGTLMGYDFVFAPATGQRQRVQIMVGVNEGHDGTIRFGNTQRHSADITVEDIGPNLGSSGYDVFRGSGDSTDNIPAPVDLVTQPYPITQTATYTLNTSTGVATRQYTGGSPRFGYWPSTGLYYLSIVQYAPWSQSGVKRSVDLGFRVASWMNSRGNIVQMGLPNFTGTPTSFNISDAPALVTQRNVGVSLSRNAELLPEQMAEVMGRASGSLLLGRTGWDASASGYQASGTASLTAVAQLTSDVTSQGGEDT